MINWWLDKGLTGFRIDAIINIKKLLPFRDFPADRDDGLCSIFRMLEQAQGITDFLGEMAENTFRPHDAFTVGEVFNEKEGEVKRVLPNNLPDFAAGGGALSLAPWQFVVLEINNPEPAAK